MLTYDLVIFFTKLRVFVFDDLAHSDLGQFLGHEFFVEKAALKGGLVLNKGSKAHVYKPGEYMSESRMWKSYE
jgi:hypothetical protein